jgi:hypothetical protein
MLQANPAITPDIAKATLQKTATARGAYGAASGLINAKGAAVKGARGTFAGSPANVGLIPSTGTGSLDESRGSIKSYVDLPEDGLGENDADGEVDELKGEIDALGNSWKNLGWDKLGPTPIGMTNLGWENTAWSSTAWTDRGSTGTGWSDDAWSGVFWTNVGWDNVGWDNVGWENLGWENLGWENLGWQHRMRMDP